MANGNQKPEQNLFSSGLTTPETASSLGMGPSFTEEQRRKNVESAMNRMMTAPPSGATTGSPVSPLGGSSGRIGSGDSAFGFRSTDLEDPAKRAEIMSRAGAAFRENQALDNVVLGNTEPSRTDIAREKVRQDVLRTVGTKEPLRGGISEGPIARGNAEPVDLAQFDSELTDEELMKSGLVKGADRRTLFAAQGSKDSRVQREAQRIRNKIEKRRRSAVRKAERDEQRAFESKVRAEESKLRQDEAVAKAEAEAEGKSGLLEKQGEISTLQALQSGEFPINPETGEANPAFRARIDADIDKIMSKADAESKAKMKNMLNEIIMQSFITEERDVVNEDSPTGVSTLRSNIKVGEGIEEALGAEASRSSSAAPAQPRAEAQPTTRPVSPETKAKRLESAIATGVFNGKRLSPEQVELAKQQLAEIRATQ